jgi:predicted GNAT family N-acyltransferase
MVYSVRSAVYIAEQECPFAEEFDGNDHCATHFIGFIKGEPAGCIRARFFHDFVKLERLAVLKRFRKSTLAFELVRSGIDLARRKGFRRIYGHSREGLEAFWARFGAKPIGVVSGKRALMVTCIPRVPLNLEEIERSAGATLALYNKLISIVATWLDGVDVTMLSPAEVFLALRLLGPTLESLAILHAKISEQRGVETIAATRANLGESGMNARDVTPPAPRPKIEETLELLRSRFNDNKKPNAN